MISKWIIKDGLAIPEPDLMEWGLWFEREQRNYQRVDEIAGIRVSTIFLGVDYSYSGDPILWETLIFNEDEGGEVIDGRRFTFQDEAYDFHDKEVNKLKRRLESWPIHPVL